MNTRLILDFPSVHDALSALQRIADVPLTVGVVAGNATVGNGIDNPEFGANVQAIRNADGSFTSAPLPPQRSLTDAFASLAAPAAPPSLAAVGFGQGVTLPAGAIPITAPSAIPAPASAVAAQQATVPAAPSSIPAPPLATTVPAAPPAAAAHAPAAPAAPTAPVNGVEADRDGMPWDARIHAKTRTKNQDGTWRQKRELDPTVKTAVEAELRGLQAINAAAGNVQAAAPAAPPPAAPVPPAPTAAVPQPFTHVPATPEASGASPSEFVWTFSALAERLTPLMLTNAIPQDRVSEVLKSHGLTAFGQLSLTPNVIPAVAAELGLTP